MADSLYYGTRIVLGSLLGESREHWGTALLCSYVMALMGLSCYGKGIEEEHAATQAQSLALDLHISFMARRHGITRSFVAVKSRHFH
jgi:hypothetical protein